MGTIVSRRATFSYVGRGQQKTAVLVPVKPFTTAKTRLEPVCTPAERESLAKSMLRHVLAAAQGLRVAIISPPEADDVRRFALINGARFLTEPPGSKGLDVAIESGVAQLRHSDYERVIVVHSDIPGARDVSWLADTEGIIIVPDRTGRGTNAISLPTDIDFHFSYGPGSLERHCAEARRCGFDPKVIVDPDGLSADVDEPDDLKKMAILENN